MAECTDCEERNPVIPTYSKAVPFVNENCGDCDDNALFSPPEFGANGKPTIVTGIEPIEVDDQTDSLAYKFVTRYSPIAQLTVALTLVAKDSLDAVLSGIILLGKVVATVELSWVYNRPTEIASQTLTNDGGINEPTLLPDAVVFDYLSQAIGTNVDFTIAGDDGLAFPTSLAEETKSIVFGNYRTFGEGARRDLGSTSATNMKSFIDGLIGGAGTIEKTTTRVKNPLIGEGLTVNDFFYYAYPKSWGFATFFQNGFPGGFKRLANVAGTIEVASLDSLEAGELDLLIDNGIAEESFYVYQSTNGFAEGAEFEVR
jgi:hypothetical protein